MKKIVLSIALMAAFTGIKAQENSTKPFSHMDLADLILESITQNSATQNPTFQQIKQYISPKCHDEIEALIKDLDLEFWGVVKIEEKEIE